MKNNMIAVLASVLLSAAPPGVAGPLHDAAVAGDLAGIRSLIDSGVDVNARDVRGATPLHYAAIAGPSVAVELLLRGGADWSLRHGEDSSALFVAMRKLDYAQDAVARAELERIVQLLQKAASTFPPPPPALVPAITAMTSALRQQMVTIPAGSFQMGDLTGKIRMQLPHGESVRNFSLSKYEVTFEQYDLYAQATGRNLPFDEGWGRGKRPVVNVSWEEAQAFIAWLNVQTGLRYRLPTEPEWEYAARAGSRTRYPWGDKFDMRLANSVGVPGKRSGSGDTWPDAAPAGSFPPNAWGLHDMSGNVNEWTGDCHATDQRGMTTYAATGTRSLCAMRVFRGGSFANESGHLQSASRNSRNLSLRMSDTGFRLALDAAD